MVQTVHAILAGQDEAAAAISRLVALGVGHEAIRTFGAANAVHVGSFADSGEHAHTPERDHVGSFADGDGNSVQQRTFVGALVAIGLARADAEAAAQAIAVGGVLVVARADPGQAEAVTAALKQHL